MSWVFKICVDGPTGAGKSSLLGKTCLDDLEKDFSQTFGFNIFIKNFYLDNGELCKFQFWDINRDFIIQTDFFSRGSSALLLFYDVNDPLSLQRLPELIERYRENSDHSPILLIGSKIDLGIKIKKQEIERIIHDYDLRGPYYVSAERPLSFEVILWDLMQDLIKINDIHLLSERELESFENFFSYFSRCPLCGNNNHENDIRRFYFSKDPLDKSIKKRLLALMNESIQDYFNQDIILGIPCCSCFSKLFKLYS